MEGADGRVVALEVKVAREIGDNDVKHLHWLREQLGPGLLDAAVITVPAYFTLLAKQLTEEAGKEAGLHVAQILQEPVAAALMYCINDPRDPLRIMTYDLGGGTFDVTILDVGEGVFEVRATCGDPLLGGDDWDARLMEWMAAQFEERNGVNLRRDRLAMQRLKESAAKAKVAAIESRGAAIHAVLPFGDPRVDRRLAGGGLPLGRWHEAVGEGLEIETAAAAGAFVAALVAPLARRGAVVESLHGFNVRRFATVTQPDAVLHPPEGVKNRASCTAHTSLRFDSAP